MVMHSSVGLAVFRAADVLQFQPQLCISALQSADIIAQDVLCFLLRLRLFAGTVGQMQGNVILCEIAVHQTGQFFLCVFLVQLLLYLTRRLAP